MSQHPSTSGPAKSPLGPQFWMTAIGGIVIGALAVIIVLWLARRTGDDEAAPVERPRPAAEAPADKPSTEP